MCDLIDAAAARLASHGVPDPELDAIRIACWASGLDRAGIVLASAELARREDFRKKFEDGIEARCRRVPLQHIEGTAAFLDFEVVVGPGVLIPRPETEVVAQTAFEIADELQSRSAAGRLRLLDAGTGTGVLAIALARRYPDAEVHATERSTSATIWAARNKAALAPQIELHEAWYLGAPGTFDLVVANPPYVAAEAWTGLEPEVRVHDPKAALVPASDDAFADVELLIRETPQYLRQRGALVCEIGSDQADRALACAARAGFQGTAVRPDLAGRDRVLVARTGEGKSSP